MYNAVQYSMFESNELDAATVLPADALADAKERVGVIESLVVAYVDSLRSGGTFPEDTGSEKKEDPTVLLWTLHFTAQHFNALGFHVSNILSYRR